MTADLLSMISGMVISLVCSYVPGINAKWAELASDAKRLIMLGLLAIVAGAMYGLACAGWLFDLTGVQLVCGREGFVEVIRAFVLALIANQSVYAITPGVK